MIKAKVITKLIIEAEVDVDLNDDGSLAEVYNARMLNDIACESALVVEKAPEEVCALYNNTPASASFIFDEAYDRALHEALYQVRARKGQPRNSVTKAFVSPPGGAKA